jgi:hypothetical protein
MAYVFYKLRIAARDIRAAYVPPGSRTRFEKDVDGHHIPQKRPLSLDVSIWKDLSGQGAILVEAIPSPVDQMEALFARLHAEWLLDHAELSAPEPVFSALEQIYRGGATLTEAAVAVDTHRSTLRRRINRWVDTEAALLAV